VCDDFSHSAIPNSRECLTDTRRSIAQPDVAEVAAGIAKFNKSAVFDGFYKRLTTRCGTF
jgi:hypothetical protein